MNTDICLVSVGACTAIGADLWSSAAAVRAGLTGFAEHPYMIDRAGEPMVVARAPYIEPDMPIATRMSFFGARAALHAYCEVLPRLRHNGPIPMVVGIPHEIPGFREALEDNIGDELGTTDALSLETAPVGHSAALLALQTAVDRISSGAAEVCLVGGVDSYLDAERLEALDETGQLHSPSNPWGFIPGEGAAFCAITTVQNARRRDIPSLGRVASVASSYETNRIRTGSVCIGLGLSDAIRVVLAALGPGVLVDTVLSDMNGDAYRADEYGFAIARMSEHFRDATAVTTPADCWGDVGAASGMLLLALALAATHKGYADGPRALVWTSSDSGERAAALLEFDNTWD